jgi:hypothetical protein
VQRTDNDARPSRNTWRSKNTWKQHAAQNAKSCSFDARSTTMYLADRTAAEYKPHVRSVRRWIHKIERTKIWLGVSSSRLIEHLDLQHMPMGRVRKLGSTSSMLAELVAIANALVKVAANVDMT